MGILIGLFIGFLLNLSRWLGNNLFLKNLWNKVGGVTKYFAFANSGFIPWKLAFLSFTLVFATKVPLSILTGGILTYKQM